MKDEEIRRFLTDNDLTVEQLNAKDKEIKTWQKEYQEMLQKSGFNPTDTVNSGNASFLVTEFFVLLLGYTTLQTIIIISPAILSLKMNRNCWRIENDGWV